MRLTPLAVSTLFITGSSLFAADAPPTVSQVFDKQLSMVEREFTSLADAMPADKYNFAPTGGEFKGVRTFAEQVKHVAAANYGVCSSVLGEKPPVDLGKDEKGPESMTGKDDIVKFAKDSFAYCHKATATLTSVNVNEQIEGGEGHKVARGYLSNIPIWHSFDHYGQMVVYARMNGVVPPASRQ